MLETLERGTTLVVDRYSYSGMAYTMAKQLPGLDLVSGPALGLSLRASFSGWGGFLQLWYGRTRVSTIPPSGKRHHRTCPMRSSLPWLDRCWLGVS